MPFQQHFTPQLGIEIEFVLVHKPTILSKHFSPHIPADEGSPFDPDDKVTPASALAYYLSHSCKVPCNSDWTPDERAGELYSKWHVGTDRLKLSSRERIHVPEGYEQAAIELKSRILSAGENWQVEVQKVLQGLRAFEAEFKCQILTNESCGMHVHIGRMGDSGKVGRGGIIPVPIAKRLFQLVTAHEHNIEQMHSVDRIRYPKIQGGRVRGPAEENGFQVAESNIFYKADSGYDNAGELVCFRPPSFYHRGNGISEAGISGNSTLDKQAPKGNIFRWLQAIEKCTSYAELSQMTRVVGDADIYDGHWAAYNFDNSVPELPPNNDTDSKGTIEFRQHAGSVDYLEVRYTVELYLKLISVSQRFNNAKFFWLLAQATDPTFGLKEFLEQLSCDDELVAHYVRDGRDDEIIGHLPDPSRQLATYKGGVDEHQALAEQNDEDIGVNSERDAIVAAVNGKMEMGGYGVNLEGSAIPISIEGFEKLLEGVGMIETGLGADSRTRAHVLKLLAQSYSVLDSKTSASDQEKVWAKLHNTGLQLKDLTL